MSKKISEPNLDLDAYDLKGMKNYFKSGGGGFMYEDSIFERCKKLGLVPKTFTPAGSANDLPDLLLSVAPGQSTKKTRY